MINIALIRSFIILPPLFCHPFFVWKTLFPPVHNPDILVAAEGRAVTFCSTFTRHSLFVSFVPFCSPIRSPQSPIHRSCSSCRRSRCLGVEDPDLSGLKVPILRG